MAIPLPSTRASHSRTAESSPSVRWSVPELFTKRRRLGDKAKADLYGELHMLISAGVDPGTVLDVLMGARGPQDRGPSLYRDLRTALAQGRTLSGAFAAQGTFSSYEEQSVRLGEETGRLAEVLAELAEHFNAKVKLRRTLISAFAYPGFVMGVTFCVVAFMLRVVVPMFSDVFKRSGAELPALTRAVVRMSAWSGPAMVIMVGTIVLIAVAFTLLKDDPRMRAARSWSSIRLPLIGPIYRKAQFARLYRALASMLAAQLPLDRALELAIGLVDMHGLQRALEAIKEQVVRGVPLHEACAQHALFDRKDIAMIAVAEEVRQLDRIFLRLAEERTAEVQHRTSLMGSVLEPVMIVCIAVFVGVVLVAMYLPMFKLSTAF